MEDRQRKQEGKTFSLALNDLGDDLNIDFGEPVESSQSNWLGVAVELSKTKSVKTALDYAKPIEDRLNTYTATKDDVEALFALFKSANLNKSQRDIIEKQNKAEFDKYSEGSGEIKSKIWDTRMENIAKLEAFLKNSGIDKLANLSWSNILLTSQVQSLRTFVKDSFDKLFPTWSAVLYSKLSYSLLTFNEVMDYVKWRWNIVQAAFNYVKTNGKLTQVANQQSSFKNYYVARIEDLQAEVIDLELTDAQELGKYNRSNFVHCSFPINVMHAFLTSEYKLAESKEKDEMTLKVIKWMYRIIEINNPQAALTFKDQEISMRNDGDFVQTYWKSLKAISLSLRVSQKNSNPRGSDRATRDYLNSYTHKFDEKTNM